MFKCVNVSYRKIRVLMHQIGTVKNAKFNTYDVLPEYGGNLLPSIPLHLSLHGVFSNDSSIEFRLDNLSLQ